MMEQPSRQLPLDVQGQLAAFALPVAEALTAYTGPERVRVLRCVLYLAAGNEQKALEYLAAANRDYRDVIFWAEYDGLDKRLRNFDEPLEDA